MKPGSGAPESKSSPESTLISEVFHSLSQPLTALHCSLDLALRRDRTLQQLRASVQTALDNAERLRQRLLLIRALNDAADPGDVSQAIDLSALLRELGEDMLPLFESAERTLELQIDCGPLLVRADKAKLAQALFCFLEYLFRYLPERGRLAICLDRCGGEQAEIKIDTASCLPVAPGEEAAASPYSCEIELVRRTLVAAGGEFGLLSCTEGRSVWRAALPLAQA